MTSQDYLIWEEENGTPYACHLHEFKGFDDDDIYDMWGGKSVRDAFSPNAEFRMNPDFPEHTVFAATLNNIHSLIVGSERLKEFLEGQEVDGVEYLPVTIRDHKGKKAARYYLINPLAVLDCIDHKASGTVFSKLVKTDVERVRRLVLREDRLDPKLQIFRISGYPDGILVREDLAKAIHKAFPGIKFKKLPPKKK